MNIPDTDTCCQMLKQKNNHHDDFSQQILAC